MAYKPTGRPPGRPRKYPRPDDDVGMSLAPADPIPLQRDVPQAPPPITRNDQRTLVFAQEIVEAKRQIWSSLCATGNPSIAASMAGVSYHQHKQWLRDDTQYSEDIDEAMEIFGHALQDRMLEQAERHPMLLIAVAKKVQNGEYDSGTTTTSNRKGGRLGPRNEGDPDKLLGTGQLSTADLQRRVREAVKIGLPGQSAGVRKPSAGDHALEEAG